MSEPNKYAAGLFREKNNDFHNSIDDRTWHDLEMDSVFAKINKTSSKTGEQCLYDLLRSDYTENEKENFRQKIKHFQNDKQAENKCRKVLDTYEKACTYRLPWFIYNENQARIPLWPKILSFAFVSCGIGFFINPFFLLPLILLGITNAIVHYYLKRTVGANQDVFRNFSGFYKACNNLARTSGEPSVFTQKELSRLKSLSRKCAWFTYNYEYADDLSAVAFYLIEIIKGVFLLDAIKHNATLDYIIANKPLVIKAYLFIGTTDAALAIAELHNTTPGCEPIITGEREIIMTEGRHPLIHNCIANSITISNSGMVITGGNMSGKSIFLKTLGINLLLAKTIGFAFCRQLTSPPLGIMSSIINSDKLDEGKSYFMDELHRANDIIVKAKTTTELVIFLFDEIFKGTNSIDRIALGSATLDYLSMHNCFVVATTHDLEIVDFVSGTYQTYFFDNTYADNKVVFDYTIRKGVQNKSNVMALASSLGLPETIIENALNYREKTKTKKENPR